MNDDLVKRLRYCAPDRRDCDRNELAMLDAADRIEKLEAELHNCFHRIEELQAALREIVGFLEDPTGGQHVADMRRASDIARKALEGKDE